MAMTVNPPPTHTRRPPFREEAIYAFRFDTDGDGRDEVAFKSGSPIAPDHSQAAQRTGANCSKCGARGAARRSDGELLMHGRTDEIGVAIRHPRVAGVVGELFTGDATALEAFKAGAEGGIGRQESPIGLTSLATDGGGSS